MSPSFALVNSNVSFSIDKPLSSVTISNSSIAGSSGSSLSSLSSKSPPPGLSLGLSGISRSGNGSSGSAQAATPKRSKHAAKLLNNIFFHCLCHPFIHLY